MSRALAAAFALLLLAPAGACAQTQTVFKVSLHPDHPRALATLQISLRYEDPQASVPEPLRRTLLRLPEGLNVEVPRLRSCSPRALRARGPKACPPASVLGGGSALAQAQAGSQILSEHVTLTTVLGPLVGLQPTFDVFAQGYTPFGQRELLSGTVVPDEPPYGEDMVLAVPPIATLPLEPNVSIASLTLRIGPPPGAHRRAANAVVVPSHCPRGGLPFAVRTVFADGTTSTATTSIPCP
jgi:hypothetical protein